MDQVLQVEWDITEKDLVDYENKIKETDDLRYVFYDPDTGIISSISNMSTELNLPYVHVTYTEVKDILEGKEKINDFKVIFSPDEKDFVLVRIDQQQEILETIHDIIFQIPFLIDTSVPLVYDSMNDITLIQDYTDTCWKIYINGKLADSLKEKKLYFDNYYEIYVTAFNDPNILYKTMIIPLKNLIENYYFIIPFDEIENEEMHISLYCRKIFSKYQHIKTRL